MSSLGIPEGAEFAVLFCSNVAVFVIKLLAYFHTGSAAMLSEAIHSLVDALNQVRYLRPPPSLVLWFAFGNMMHTKRKSSEKQGRPGNRN